MMVQGRPSESAELLIHHYPGYTLIRPASCYNVIILRFSPIGLNRETLSLIAEGLTRFIKARAELLASSVKNEFIMLIHVELKIVDSLWVKCDCINIYNSLTHRFWVLFVVVD